MIDCQPGGCGRDARMLVKSLRSSPGLPGGPSPAFICSVTTRRIIGCGRLPEEEAVAYFVEEVSTGTRETDGAAPAAAIKVGYEGHFKEQYRVLLEAAAEAARQTDAPLLFHTEAGQNVEALPTFFEDRGVPGHRLYFCHMDKRPDLGLHRELAQAGILLGYDTFVRSTYKPEQNVWPLLKAMVAQGWGDYIALGLDMARTSFWRNFGGQPGLVYLVDKLIPRLRQEGISDEIIAKLTGQNVTQRLARTDVK
ncbi:MAG: hypothetical protein U0401_01825 [Anaerolineae bacterium]